MNKKTPFSKELMQENISNYGSPFYVYDEIAIRENIRDFKNAFSWVSDFREYYAVKACPNPEILKILKEEGCGADCSSFGELILSEKVGITGEDIMFTSNNTPVGDFKKARELGAIINFDDISHIPYFLENVGSIGDLACCRYNPGPLKEGNAIIGDPEEAKYGMTRPQLFEAYRLLKEAGVTRFALHTMVASNELDPMYFVDTAELLFNLVIDIEKELDISFESVNLGGGIGIPYKPEEKKVDIKIISSEMKKVYDRLFFDRKTPLNIVAEMGRMVTGPYGYLITSVIHFKDTYKSYIGTDASMSDLMRPGMYGAYHHITVMGKEGETETKLYDVTGALCENNDKFAVDRHLPASIERGDILVIHDAGAHGHSMGFNYNSMLRPAEFLLTKDNKLKMIRRAETLDDHFATLEF